jgi:extracellular elastinolytic metalloproteinase
MLLCEDFFATTIRSSKVYSDYPMGAWAANSALGIRFFNYSLDHTVNPSTYKILDKPEYYQRVHAIGEVWAEILRTVNHKLIAKHGYVDSLFPPAALENGTIPTGDFYRTQELDPTTGKWKPLVPNHGNSLMVQYVLPPISPAG